MECRCPRPEGDPGNVFISPTIPTMAALAALAALAGVDVGAGSGVFVPWENMNRSPSPSEMKHRIASHRIARSVRRVVLLADWPDSIMYSNLSKSLSKSILFLFSFAWESRLRLPLLITISFMVLDVRMQLEINVNVANRDAEAGNEDNELEDDEEMEIEAL
uniref:Uncharacterized protein n=1 Tax=Strigamia maritima TaxID=126957 RepID=T1IRK3_STRMM